MLIRQTSSFFLYPHLILCPRLSSSSSWSPSRLHYLPPAPPVFSLLPLLFLPHLSPLRAAKREHQNRFMQWPSQRQRPFLALAGARWNHTIKTALFPRAENSHKWDKYCCLFFFTSSSRTHICVDLWLIFPTSSWLRLVVESILKCCAVTLEISKFNYLAIVNWISVNISLRKP